MKKTTCATVVKHTGSHYMLSELPQWKEFPAVARGKIRLNGSVTTNPVAAGDRVVCELPEGCGSTEEISAANPATILEVLPRKNYVIRKSTNLSRQSHIIAANVDKAFIVVTLAFPEIKLPFLDRLLVTCEVYGIPAAIVLNKVDLIRTAADGNDDATEEQAGIVEWFKGIYGKAGYPVIETCATSGEGIDELKDSLATVNLLSGESGVGKSSLIKALNPSLNPRTAEISISHLQGRHTTTFYEMYPIGDERFIIDTPGIRSFGLDGIKPEETAVYFPEMLKVSAGCRFTPCTHTHEPDCAVKRAVEDGEISPERYSSYLGMLEENRKYR